MVRNVITYQELALHRKPGDRWIAIAGKVYDVSKYDDHPGKTDVFEEAAGKDATAAFEDANHSRVAIDLLDRFLVGTLADTPTSSNALPLFLAALVGLILLASASVLIIGR